jgi:hypothetical protein
MFKNGKLHQDFWGEDKKWIPACTFKKKYLPNAKNPFVR